MKVLYQNTFTIKPNCHFSQDWLSCSLSNLLNIYFCKHIEFPIEIALIHHVTPPGNCALFYSESRNFGTSGHYGRRCSRDAGNDHLTRT